jgi:hypothetical protein
VITPADELKRLATVVDRLDTRLDSIDLTLARNTASLEEHVRRTNALEALVVETKKDIKPIQDHVVFMKTLAYLGGLLVSALFALKSLF